MIDRGRLTSEGDSSFATRHVLRWLPFVLLSVLSLVVAAGPRRPRKKFYIDPDLSVSALVDSFGKTSHWEATALVFLFAWFGAGNRRLGVAFGLTLLVCVSWEIAEATAVGHTGRLSDLAPDLSSALLSLAIAGCVRRWWSGRKK